MLDSAEDTTNLGGRTARGGAVAVIAQALKFIITIAATSILARLLTPQDYGLIGMVAIIVGFLGMFQYMGLSTATLKWSELTHDQVTSLFVVPMGPAIKITLRRPRAQGDFGESDIYGCQQHAPLLDLPVPVPEA